MTLSKRTLWLSLLLTALLSVAACARARPDAELATTLPPVVQTVIVRETVVVERVVEVTPTPDPSLQPVILRLNLEGEPSSIDPALADDPGALDLVANLFLGLIRIDDQGHVLPELASDWSVSQDGLRWVFNLAAELPWVSYRPASGAAALDFVAADDVVYAVRRACDPRTGAARVELNYIIAGCQALHTADLATLSAEEIQALIEAVGVLALNDATVQVTLVEPAGHLPAVMALPINRPLHRPTLEQHGSAWTEPGNIVSNGPYLLAGWFHGDSMALARNPRWPGWQQAPGNVQRVAFSIAPAAQALEAYRAGELDSMAVPRELLTTIAADQRLSAELATIPTSCSEYYGFDNSRPPLDNALVRRALSAAIDRQALVQTVTAGGELPANIFAPSMVWGSAAGDATLAPWALPEQQGGWGYAQALAQAQAWLAEAGYAGGEGLPALTLLHNAADGPAQTAQAVAAMWRAGLGVEVVVQSLPWPEYWQRLGELGGYAQTGAGGEELPQVWRMGYCGDLADQDNWLGEEFSTERGIDRLRWAASANAPLAADGRSFNQLIAAARQSSDPAERQALYQEAEHILNDTAAAIIPLVHYSEAILTRPGVQRTFDALNGHWFAAWRID
jgi:oligopeptide transport system substrate-binding protein